MHHGVYILTTAKATLDYRIYTIKIEDIILQKKFKYLYNLTVLFNY